MNDLVSGLKAFFKTTPWFLFLPFVLILVLIPFADRMVNNFYYSWKDGFYQMIRPERNVMKREDPGNRSLKAVVGTEDYHFFPRKANSRIVEDILKNNQEIAFLINDEKFSEPKNLFNYLHFIGAEREELKAMAFYYTATDNKIIAAEKITGYLQNVYLYNIRELLSRGNTGLFRERAKNAYRILSLMDTPPVGGVGYKAKRVINEILLLNMLVSNDELIHYKTDQLLDIFNVAFYDFSGSQQPLLQKLESTSDFQDIIKYWKGVYAWRADQLDEAELLFAEVEDLATNFYLKDLAVLMQARCLHNKWQFERDMEQPPEAQEREKAVIVEKLESFSEKIVKTSLKSDVVYYTQRVESTEVIRKVPVVDAGNNFQPYIFDPGSQPNWSGSQGEPSEDDVLLDLLRIILKLAKERH